MGKRIWSGRVILILMLVFVFHGYGAVHGEVKSGEPVVVQSKNSFEKTVAGIKKAIRKRGLSIVFEANHKNMMAMVGIESRKSLTIGFAKPQMGAKVMGIEPKAAIEMPMRLAVRELNDGSIVVIYYKPSYLFSHYHNPRLTRLGKKMDRMIEGIVRAGIQ